MLVWVGCGAAPANPVEGVIVELDGHQMTVTADDGRTYEFTISDPTVTVAHLRVHMREELPVRITWTSEDGRRRATMIADAPRLPFR